MKRLRVILLFLLLGAIVNVAVAWGCASFVNFSMYFQFAKSGGKHGGSRVTSSTGAYWGFDREDIFGSTIIVGSSFLEADRTDALWMHHDSIVDMHVPAWSLFADAPTIRISVTEESRGWPLRTLTWVETNSWWYSGFFIPRKRYHVWIVGEFPKKIYLPLAPIWSGLFLNTLFYASLLWLLIPGPFVLRRYIRSKRGHCVKCAYDLRGAEHEACPECGEEIRKGNPA